MAAMSERWEHHTVCLDGGIASIAVDMALRGLAPEATLPNLLCVAVALAAPPGEEKAGDIASALERVGADIMAALARDLEAMPVGRINRGGRLELYAYAPRRENVEDCLESAVSRAITPHSTYRFMVLAQSDPLWSQYLKVLYPGVHGMQQIRSRHLIAALDALGDSRDVPRPVSHWIRCRRDDHRQIAADRLSARGFGVVLIEPYMEAKLPFGLRVERVGMVTYDAVMETVGEVLDALQQLEVQYDGWESPVVR